MPAIADPSKRTKFTKRELRDRYIAHSIKVAEERIRAVSAKDSKTPFVLVLEDGTIAWGSYHASQSNSLKRGMKAGCRALDLRTGRVHPLYDSLPE